MIIRKITGYKTSNNYDALWETAKKQSVICLVDYGETTRDVAKTISDGVFVNVSARGIQYVGSNLRKEFKRQCESVNLGWIVPGDAE